MLMRKTDTERKNEKLMPSARGTMRAFYPHPQSMAYVFLCVSRLRASAHRPAYDIKKGAKPRKEQCRAYAIPILNRSETLTVSVGTGCCSRKVPSSVRAEPSVVRQAFFPILPPTAARPGLVRLPHLMKDLPHNLTEFGLFGR